MTEWSVFWICLFSYWAVKYIVNALTYDKHQALKDVAKEELVKGIGDINLEELTDIVNKALDELKIKDK